MRPPWVKVKGSPTSHGSDYGHTVRMYSNAVAHRQASLATAAIRADVRLDIRGCSPLISRAVKHGRAATEPAQKTLPSCPVVARRALARHRDYNVLRIQRPDGRRIVGTAILKAVLELGRRRL
jgi:hypothetical protein